MFNSYSWQRAIVIAECGKFFSSRLATGILELIAVPLVVKIGLDQNVLGIDGGLAKIIVSLAVVIINYLSSKFMVFSNKEND